VLYRAKSQTMKRNSCETKATSHGLPDGAKLLAGRKAVDGSSFLCVDFQVSPKSFEEGTGVDALLLRGWERSARRKEQRKGEEVVQR